jgi:hypothetical protein
MLRCETPKSLRTSRESDYDGRSREKYMKIHGYAALYSTAIVFAVTSILVKQASRYASWVFVSV